jgi:Xaa-Pro aminopeptidase
VRLCDLLNCKCNRDYAIIHHATVANCKKRQRQQLQPSIEPLSFVIFLFNHHHHRCYFIAVSYLCDLHGTLVVATTAIIIIINKQQYANDSE